ncbi:hypothetical protein [Rhizobium sp. NFACC06-2]|uniref:hypothetical protein n=1 Tax=Rhizobium sp. NFACC06-2 TaxID=1566264 RepID=UPI00165FE11C|nr:hypothetical protein [Rhizobium sp. NFACC06-2]
MTENSAQHRDWSNESHPIGRLLADERTDPLPQSVVPFCLQILEINQSSASGDTGQGNDSRVLTKFFSA